MLTLLSRLFELVILRICSKLCLEEHLTSSPKTLLPIIAQHRPMITAELIKNWGFDESWLNLIWNCFKTDRQDTRNDVFQAQRLATEFGSAKILNKKNRTSSGEVAFVFRNLPVPDSFIQELITREPPQRDFSLVSPLRYCFAANSC